MTAAHDLRARLASLADEHGPDETSWFARGVWPRCICGLDPRDNLALNAHWAEYGFRVVDDHGCLIRKPLDTAAEPQPEGAPTIEDVLARFETEAASIHNYEGDLVGYQITADLWRELRAAFRQVGTR